MIVVPQDLLSALAELPGSDKGDLNDSHERLRVYRALLEGDRIRDDAHLDRVFALLRREPDRSLAAGVVGELLDEDAVDGVAGRALQAFPDSRFVVKRVHELAALRAFSFPDSIPTNELDEASGWLEERLAERSESAAVLMFLAHRASRRAARRLAESRLRLIEKRQ